MEPTFSPGAAPSASESNMGIIITVVVGIVCLLIGAIGGYFLQGMLNAPTAPQAEAPKTQSAIDTQAATDTSSQNTGTDSNPLNIKTNPFE